jgi:hypothetical protein
LERAARLGNWGWYLVTVVGGKKTKSPADNLAMKALDYRPEIGQGGCLVIEARWGPDELPVERGLAWVNE